MAFEWHVFLLSLRFRSGRTKTPLLQEVVPQFFFLAESAHKEINAQVDSGELKLRKPLHPHCRLFGHLRCIDFVASHLFPVP